MDVDRSMSYIFGSFSRRRQSREITATKRRSIEPSKTTTGIIKKPLQNVSPVISVTPPKSNNEISFLIPNEVEQQQSCSSKLPGVCELCNERFQDPKLLPCLHTFCARCLGEKVSFDGLWNNDFEVKELTKVSESESSSGSGYESEKPGTSSSNDSWSPKTSSEDKRIQDITIICPVCNAIHSLPPGGVKDLPSNFLLDRLSYTKDEQNAIKIICDLCQTHSTAICYCKTCTKNMCLVCTEIHRKQRTTSGHQTVNIRNNKQTQKEINCPIHNDHRLEVFCTICRQLACTVCRSDIHYGHACESIPKAVKLYSKYMNEALDLAKPATQEATSALDQLSILSKRIENRTNVVQKEVNMFMDMYKKAIEEHKQTLLMQIRRSHEDKIQSVDIQREYLASRIEEANETIKLADELLTDCTNEQFLMFVGPVLEKLEWCSEIARNIEPRVTDSIQFLHNEKTPLGKCNIQLYGMITTQIISPQNCILKSGDLKNLRVHRKAELLIETRDNDNQCLCHGGENIVAELRYHNSNTKSIPVDVLDLRDGTYSLTFTPETAGQLLLTVIIRGKHIQDSPFTVIVRTIRPHYGTFHCCTFCSSGGNKQAICKCGGTMPGGYQGCGHGHPGHPGKRHWSCCGNLLEHSECGTNISSHYQFTL